MNRPMLGLVWLGLASKRWLLQETSVLNWIQIRIQTAPCCCVGSQAKLSLPRGNSYKRAPGQQGNRGTEPKGNRHKAQGKVDFVLIVQLTHTSRANEQRAK